MSVTHTVPWHPDFTEMPGWLIDAMSTACLVIYDAGLMPPLDELAAAIEGYTGFRLCERSVAGLCALLKDYEFIERVGNAPGGSA